MDSQTMRQGSAAPMTLRPGALAPEVRARIAVALQRAIAARRRLVAQTFVERSVPALALMAIGFAAWALAARAGWCGPAADAHWQLAAALGAGGAAIAAGWQRRSLVDVAAQLDAAADGRDRLATALELAARDQRDAWADVQAAAATAFAAGLDVGRLLPWRAPARLSWLAAASACAALAVVAPLPGSGLGLGGPRAAVGLHLAWPASHASVIAAADLLGQDALELLAADAEVLADVELQVKDEATRRWIGDVRRVLRDVGEGAIDRREALSRLAALEAARPEAPERGAAAAAADPAPAGAPAGEAGAAAGTAPGREEAAAAERDRDRAVQKAVSEAVKEALQEAPAGGAKEELKKAADKGDLGALAKLVEKLAERDMSDKELEGWVKTAQKLAKQLGLKSTPKEFEDLADKVRRLEQKRAAQGGLDAADQRRLNNVRRALDTLRRDRGDVAGAQPTLQRLERGAKAAADEMRRAQQERSRLSKQGGGGAAGAAGRDQQRQALKQQIQRQLQGASDELRRQAEGQRDRQGRRVADGRIRDLRDALRRAGEDGGQRQDFERRAGDGAQRATGRPGGEQRRQPGEGGSRAEAEGRAEARRAERSGAKPREGGPEPGDSERRSSRKDALGDDGLGKEGQRQADAGARKGDGSSRGAERPSGGGQAKGARRYRLGGGDLPDDSRMGPSDPNAPAGGNLGGSDAGEGEGPGLGPDGKARRATAAKTEKVKGAHGDGPTTKRTFVDAARRGFARTGWADVYGDYKDVAQEMLDKEALPPGRRSLVRRYYELIRPR